MREAGLPPLTLDVQGEQTLMLSSKGVVRAVYPEINRVDIETEDGSYLHQVMVMGPYFPEVHKDGDAPAHVTYMHVRGRPEAFCWPETHRRLLGPDDTLKDDPGSQPERRYFHLHHYIFRVGDITVRIARDNRFVVETEHGDYVQVDSEKREIRLHAPSVFVGTDDTDQGNRIEYEQDDSIRAFNPLVLIGTEVGDRIQYEDKNQIQVVTPKCFIGQTGQPDADGISYLANSLIHLVSQTIKFTASQAITLDPPRINFGNASAAEQVILGNLFQTFLNSFLSLFNGHVHTGVQTGPGISGPPQTPTGLMPNSTLSTIARVSQ